jgi:DUF1365 family protein
VSPGTPSALPGAPALVPAHVWHRRHHPTPYEFEHRTPLWLVDLDDPNAAFPRWLRPLVSVRPRDHLAVDDRPLRVKLLEVLAERGLGWQCHRVLLLTGARSLGHAFDPLTAWFCFDRAGRLEGVLAEVHNTYGQRHWYPLEVSPATRGSLRAEVDKEFYVSPFFAVEGRYDIRLRLTQHDVAVAISLDQDGRRVFDASVQGTLQPATRGRTLRAVLRNPVASQRVSTLIRWHGVRLWLRRLPVIPRGTA